MGSRLQDVKWDGCPEPYSPGNCTPAPFSGGHNYTGWCGQKACRFNSKEGVGATVDAALNQGGIDYNCGPLYKTQLYNALQMGAVSEADIDRAAGRIYHTQIKLGAGTPQHGLSFVVLSLPFVVLSLPYATFRRDQHGTLQHGPSSNMMALITLDCDKTRSPGTSWP